jgi:hypothetical protein
VNPANTGGGLPPNGGRNGTVGLFTFGRWVTLIFTEPGTTVTGMRASRFVLPPQQHLSRQIACL